MGNHYIHILLLPPLLHYALITALILTILQELWKVYMLEHLSNSQCHNFYIDISGIDT